MGGHGPEPCEDCGVYHSYQAQGVDLDAPQTRFVRFYGFSPEGLPLYIDAEDDDEVT